METKHFQFDENIWTSEGFRQNLFRRNGLFLLSDWRSCQNRGPLMRAMIYYYACRAVGLRRLDELISSIWGHPFATYPFFLPELLSRGFIELVQ